MRVKIADTSILNEFCLFDVEFNIHADLCHPITIFITDKIPQDVFLTIT